MIDNSIHKSTVNVVLNNQSSDGIAAWQHSSSSSHQVLVDEHGQQGERGAAHLVLPVELQALQGADEEPCGRVRKEVAPDDLHIHTHLNLY